MSQTLQPGHHPDADQLSAFAEQALPAHEREATLAHLAVCAECRAVVALSLPAIEELPAPAPKPARRPWFSGWGLAIPAAVAVAALTVVVVYVYRAASTRSSAGAPPQMAVTSLPPPSEPVGQPARSAPAAAPRSAPPPSAKQRRPAPLPPTAPPVQNLNALSEAKPEAAPPTIEGKNVMALESQPREHAAASAKTKQRAAAGEGAGGGLGVGRGSGFGPAGAVHSSPQVAEDRALKMAPRAAPSLPKSLAPSAASFSGASAGAGSGQFHGASAAAMQAVSANRALDALASAEPLPILHPLPSGLPVLSIAVHGHRILALDAAHALFLSDDAGLDWKPVAVPWKSRAVRVDLISNARGDEARAQSSPSGWIGAGASPGPPPAGSSPAPAAASLAGTVQDASGAVVPRVSIVIRNPSTHTSLTLKTDANGRYAANGLATGAYDIEVQSPGFLTGRATGVKVTASEQTVRNFTLDLGSATQSVTVEAAPAQVTTVEPPPPAAALPTPIAAPAAAATPPPARQSAPASTPVFEIVTEDGARWTSSDGLAWTRE